MGGTEYEHLISVVVPVYRGEHTLPELVRELSAHGERMVTPRGHAYRVAEILLVHDNGPDGSDRVIRSLADDNELVRPIWLARNSGQHAATAAGIASSGGAWVLTMDEDGQHSADDIATMLDTALMHQSQLVYGRQRDGAPHARWRNLTSSMAKRVAKTLFGAETGAFTSFRLIEGTRARAVTAYIGPRTFLDSALTWAVDRVSSCEITQRAEWRGGSGYNLRRLLSHFWTLVLSSGTRPLRIVSMLGSFAALSGFVTAGVIIWRKFHSGYDAPGWASTIVVLLLTSGIMLLALGVVAEYVGALLRSAQGKPLYIIVDDPGDGPLGRE